MLLVDAYNVLHVTGVLPPELSGLEAPDLADLVAASRWGRHQAVLVCDGTKPKDVRTAERGHVRVSYAGGGASADAAIERMLDQPYRGPSVEDLFQASRRSVRALGLRLREAIDTARSGRAAMA